MGMLTVSQFSKLKFGSQRLPLFEIFRVNQALLTGLWDCSTGEAKPLIPGLNSRTAKEHTSLHYLALSDSFVFLKPLASSKRVKCFILLTCPSRQQRAKAVLKTAARLLLGTPLTWPLELPGRCLLFPDTASVLEEELPRENGLLFGGLERGMTSKSS